MRINNLKILILAFLLSASTYAQKIDSLILKNNLPKIENPSIKHLDSLHLKFNKSLNRFLEKEYSVSTNEHQSPSFYHIQNNGIKISLNDYLKEQLKETKNNFKAYFKIEVEWNGRINFIKLVGYTGEIDDVDFVSIWKNIKAKPGIEFSIPAKSIVTIPIYKN
ncbi:hypothetical protein [uncultured Psychroserpens sp.]|uniref:hypothetical protein n=1 Tax=uncultured Psychroserpens sp. TaxID=255436 RepID=UPI00261B5147|nr:hypothetical protein [uncultured Psychroserpens sp.]